MYMFRTRLASFMAGFASAAAASFYLIQTEIHSGNRCLADQVNKSYSELEARILHLETVTQASSKEFSDQVGAAIGGTESASSGEHSQEAVAVLEH
eukprot:c17747_g1_i1 orf=124-411(+)